MNFLDFCAIFSLNILELWQIKQIRDMFKVGDAEKSKPTDVIDLDWHNTCVVARKICFF